MKRFHFMDNEGLDQKIKDIYNTYNCNKLSIFITRVLFRNENEFLIFMTYYCQRNSKFKTVKNCKISKKVTIPDAVYHTMKLCHKELNTYSIALIWRSFLIDVVECFTNTGLDGWTEFKEKIIENGQKNEKNKNIKNKPFLKKINCVHIPGLTASSISKIVFFSFNNEFIGYLRC